MGLLTIIGFFLGIWGIWQAYNSDKKAKPVYRVVSDAALTENHLDSRIKIYFDSLEVHDVRILTIALWNAGNTFLAKESISYDDPIRIRCDQNVNILGIKVLKTSRTALKFSSIVYDRSHFNNRANSLSNDVNYCSLKIIGDEGLEVNDGALFQVVYSAVNDECNWSVNARIKGQPEGIIKAINSKDFNINFLLYYIPVFLTMLVYGTRYVLLISDRNTIKLFNWLTILTFIVSSLVNYFIILPEFVNVHDIPLSLLM